MFNRYFIHRIRNNQTTETDFYGFYDEIKYSTGDKCFFTADVEKTIAFKHALCFAWHFEEKYDVDGDTLTATIDTNGEVLKVTATYPNGREHAAVAVDFID